MTETLEVDAGVNTAAAVAVRQLTITVPGASNDFGPQQLVHLQGRVAFRSPMDAFYGCPCWFSAVIRDMTTDTASTAQSQTLENSAPAVSLLYSFDVEALFAAPPGPRTYQLEVGLTHRNTTTNPGDFAFDNSLSLSAMTFPFGPTGTSNLSAAGALNVAE